MFDKDMQIRGQHATYWKALTKVPGNAVETSRNFKIFESYITVYMVAPIIGLLYGRKGTTNPADESKDTAGMLSEVQIKNANRLKYIYRLIVLSDDSLGLTDEEKINMAFREDNNDESVKRGMELYNSYFLGGLEILYEEFVSKCVTDDDYIIRLFDYVDEFKNEHNIDKITVDIDALL